MAEKKEESDFLSNPSSKKKFMENLNKLGFPLEFKIRQKLIENGYKNVREGSFTVLAKEGSTKVTRSFDVSGHIDINKVIHNSLTIGLSLQLIGECKYSSNKNEILFAVPDMTNPDNKGFIGPLLSIYRSAKPGNYRDSYLISEWYKDFGEILISSTIHDTDISKIIGGQQKEAENDPKSIFSIVESQIIPPLKEVYVRHLQNSYDSYFTQFKDISPGLSVSEFLKLQQNGYHFGRLFIPFIVVSKKIIQPIINDKGEVVDIKEVGFTLYEHSILNPEESIEILYNQYDLGIFICNEKYFEEFLIYIEKLFNKIFDKIITTLESQPLRLLQDYNDIKKFAKEMERFKGKKIIDIYQ